MIPLFSALLIAHVLFGLMGVFLSFTTTLQLLRSEMNKRITLFSSLYASITYVLSWIVGGWYYWKYYGANVKPVIMNGAYPWAHAIFTESKEHVFLFLPVAAVALAILLRFNFDTIAADSVLKNRTMFLSLIITIVAIVVTLSGVLITGGAR